jgi:hypothetical protein
VAFRPEQVLQGVNHGVAFFFGRRLNDTGEPCKGLRATLIFGTMRELARNYRRSQGPLPPVVGWFDGCIAQEQQHPPTIMLLDRFRPGAVGCRRPSEYESAGVS